MSTAPSAFATIIYGLPNALNFKSTHKGPFYIQIASFKIKSNADNYLKNNPTKRKVPIFTRKKNGYFVILAGPINNAAEIRKASQALQSPLHKKPMRSSRAVFTKKTDLTHSKKATLPLYPPYKKMVSLPNTSNSLSKWRAKNPEFIIQLGGFYAHQGKDAQIIAIETLRGNQYTVTQHNSSNGMVGLGYSLKGWEKDNLQLRYGLNTFYFAPAQVSGNIIEELRFTNLSYQYNVNHFPLYATLKGKMKNNTDRYAVLLEAGIGPNFSKTSQYQESRIDQNSFLNNSLIGKSDVQFSATAGIGFRLNHVFGQAPLECGYRFFYLGKNSLHPSNNQVLTKLNTGDNYAQSIMCGLVI